MGAEEPGDTLILRIASEVGMKARIDKLSWQGLLAQGGVFPLIARLNDGSAVIVVGARLEGEGKVALLDPVAAQAVVTLEDQATFCARWNGTVLLLKLRKA